MSKVETISQTIICAVCGCLIHVMHGAPAGMVIQRLLSHSLLVTVLMPRAMRFAVSFRGKTAVAVMSGVVHAVLV